MNAANILRDYRDALTRRRLRVIYRIANGHKVYWHGFGIWHTDKDGAQRYNPADKYDAPVLARLSHGQHTELA